MIVNNGLKKSQALVPQMKHLNNDYIIILICYMYIKEQIAVIDIGGSICCWLGAQLRQRAEKEDATCFNLPTRVDSSPGSIMELK